MDVSSLSHTLFPSQIKEARSRQHASLPSFFFILAILILLTGLHQINYLLFHSFVEIFSVMVAGGIFILAWHTQKIIENSFFLFIGIAYLVVAGLDFTHALTYPGMGVFPAISANEPIQVWVIARFIESMALILAPSVFNTKSHPYRWMAIYVAAASLALAAIFVWPIMPQCYVAGMGLTPFKIGCEYAIALILIGAIVRLFRQRAALDKDLWRLLCAAIAVTIASEMAFTLYTDVYGIANIVGHYLKFISVFLIYQAIIKTGLVRPHKLAVQSLQHKEAGFKTIINASTDIVVLLDNRLCVVAANQAAAGAFEIPADMMLGTPLADLLPKSAYDSGLDRIKGVLDTGRPIQFEEQHKKRHFLTSIYPIADDQGQVIQLAIFCKDISEQRQSHRALVESEAKFRMLAERIEEIFWIATPDDRRFIYVSPAYEVICGKPCQELYESTKGLIAMIHPDDRLEIQMAAQKLPMDEWEIEFRIIRPDGAVRWILNRGYSIKNGSGRVDKICGVARDITDRKHLEHRLVEAHHKLEQRVEDRTCALTVAIQQLKHQVAKRTKMSDAVKEKHSMLNTLLQAIPDRVSFKDADGRYQLANKAFLAFYEIKNKELIGRTDSDLKLPGMARLAMKRDRQVLQLGHSLNFESRLPFDSDDPTYWDVRKVPVKDGNGSIIGILNLSRDITAFKQREAQLKQSKATLRAFLDGISEPMVMMDPKLRLVYINRAAALAYPVSHDQSQARTCLGMLCDGQHPCSRCFVPDLISQKRQHSFERARNGNPERIEMVDIYPLSQDRDGLDGAIVRIRDITQARQVERQMIHSEKMASLGMLISGIAHEINNPNSFITFNVPILKAYLDKIFAILDTHPKAVSHGDWFGMNYSGFREEIYGLLENLSHGSVRINNIVGNLKVMTHPKSSNQRLKMTDIQGVIEKAVTLCRGEINKHISNFEVVPKPGILEALIDPEGLEQVLINLLINAVQAADKPNSWIRLRVIPPDETNETAIIEVQDNGCGMDPATRDSIFDPFFTTKAPGVGTGLGLSVSYNLIGQMGGQIRVESTLGKGAKFTIQLPLNNKNKELPANTKRRQQQAVKF